MFFTVTPVAERPSIAWTYVAKDYEALGDDETRRFEDIITLQDIPSWNLNALNSYRSIYKPNFTRVPTALPLPTVSGSDNWG